MNQPSSAQARATHAAHKTDQRPRQPREVRLHDKIDEAVEGLGTNVCWPDPAFRSGCRNHQCPRSPFSAWLSSAAHWLAAQVHVHSHTHPWWTMSTPAATRSSVSGTASCSVASGFDCIESMRNPAVGPRAGCGTARKVAGRNLIVDGPARGANDAAGTTTRSETRKRIRMFSFNKSQDVFDSWWTDHHCSTPRVVPVSLPSNLRLNLGLFRLVLSPDTRHCLVQPTWGASSAARKQAVKHGAICRLDRRRLRLGPGVVCRADLRFAASRQKAY